MRTVDPLSDLTAAIKLINSQPAFPAQLRCGALALAALRACASGTVPQATIPSPISGLLGVPIVPDASMAPEAWKMLDVEGRTLREGTVAWEVEPIATDDDGTGVLQYEPGPRWLLP